MMDFDRSTSSILLFLMWHNQNEQREKNNKRRKSWLEWLFG